MRRILVVVVTTSLLLALAGPVAADHEPLESFKFRDSFTGQQANAFWFSCESDTPAPGFETCTFVDLFASTGTAKFKVGPGKPESFTFTDVCIFTFTEVITPEGDFIGEEFMFGCDSDPSLTIAGDLSSATLDATITFFDFECEEDEETGEIICIDVPIGTAELSATWTATGPLTRFKEQSRFMEISPEHRCASSSNGRGVRRAAVATGTLAGESLGDSDASLSDGTFRFSATCRFTGAVCSARYTMPKPPWPIRSVMTYAPMRSPGAIGFGPPELHRFDDSHSFEPAGLVGFSSVM
jgi:hypothetical protein